MNHLLFDSLGGNYQSLAVRHEEAHSQLLPERLSLWIGDANSGRGCSISTADALRLRDYIDQGLLGYEFVILVEDPDQPVSFIELGLGRFKTRDAAQAELDTNYPGRGAFVATLPPRQSQEPQP